MTTEIFEIWIPCYLCQILKHKRNEIAAIISPEYIPPNEFADFLHDKKYDANPVCMDCISKGRDGGDRTYSSLLNGRFKLAGEVVRIELKNDPDGISNAAFDLTTKTIGNMIAQGENDAKDILERILRESNNGKLKQSLA